MLSVNHIDVYYRSVQVLYDISLEIKKGEIFALLGRNGAGKTTLLQSCVGLLPVRNGSIRFQNEQVKNSESCKVCSRGIGYVFQQRSVFPELSVIEHLRLAITKSFTAKSLDEAVNETITLFPDIGKRLKARGGTLSGGEAQMLEISMALVRKPKLLLLDEPSQGLSSINIRRFMNKLQGVKGEMTVFLSEQNIRVALELSDDFAVIRDGMIVYEGKGGNVEEGGEIAKKYILS